MHDPNDRQEWIIDHETAPIVQRIFQGIINGKGVTHIADELTAEGILTPNAYWESTGATVSRGAHNDNPCRWSAGTVIAILKKEDYKGWKALNKTVKDNYKSKKRENNPENKLIFKDSHPAIIDEETWNVVQRLSGTKRRVYKLSGEPNPLTGVLYCADCPRPDRALF